MDSLSRLEAFLVLFDKKHKATLRIVVVSTCAPSATSLDHQLTSLLPKLVLLPDAAAAAAAAAAGPGAAPGF